MQGPSHREVLENVSLYLNEQIQDQLDKGVQKFIEVVGSDDPVYWEKNGYDMLDIDHTHLLDGEMLKRTRILRRGKTHAITGFQTVAGYFGDKMQVITKALTEQEAKEILAKR